MAQYTRVISLALLVTYAYDAAASTLPEHSPCRVRRQAGGRACRCSLAAPEEDVVSDVQPPSLAAPEVSGPAEPCVQSAQPAEDPPKIFEPEVDLLSSVLGTLHKVSDQNYKEAATKEITEETNRLREAVAFKDGLLKATSKLTREHPELPKLPKIFDKLGSLKYREDDYVPDISRSPKVASAFRGSGNSNARVVDSEPSASEDVPVYSRERPRLAPLLPTLPRKPNQTLKSNTNDQDCAKSPNENNSKALQQILNEDQALSLENRSKKIKSFLSSKNKKKVSADSDVLQSMSPEMADQITAAIKKTLSGTSNSYRCRIIFE